LAIAFPNPIYLKTDFTPILSITNPFFFETKISFSNENIPRTMKSEENSVQTKEETPEEGLNTKFYIFFDRLSR